MGEASWDAQLQYTQGLMATAEAKGQSRKSQKLPWPCDILPRRPPWKTRSCQDTPSTFNILRTVLLALFLPIRLSTAAFINFGNCLSPDTINSNNPETLQFVPLFVWATFNTSAESYNLNVTAYGNVAGIATQQPYPSQTDPQWTNPNDTVGKIPDVYGSGPDALYTTFTTEFNVLDYTPYAPDAARFCNTSSVTACPVAPVFNFNGTDNISELPGITAAHDLYSSYAFTSINTFLRLKSGDPHADPLACIEASVTPDLGHTISRTLTYLPLVVLILVAIATATAAIFSPWGSTDVFKFTSNYGRDDDLLRLVTPGFGDCLQYIQFIVLIGSLSLNYPGFYQPVVSQVSWSALMFNESFVTHGSGSQSLLDGIYVANGSYGLDRMSQLVGMTADKDIWAGMVIWLLVIVVSVVTLIQIGFACRWAYRFISDTREEDLRQKNLPFSLGNAIRVVFNYFLLPIVALSTFQLVIAGHSPGSTVGFATVLLVALIGFAGFLLWLIATTRPRSYLFDDLPTVLLYGPLYNTYSDNAATFALVPVMLTFIRGIAIGAVQPSGIAQLVLLAICEVINILTLNAFRPFHSPTSMNAFHTFFAVVRLLTVLLSVAFLPSLGVKDAPRGWIGYIILLMHAIVLVFGFFLNACQTLIEVLARLAGAGGEEGVGGGAARGGLVKVFGMRQLSRRNPRRSGRARQSVTSDAAILAQESDQKSLQWNGGRSRSMSGSSAILLNRQGTSDNRTSVGLDSVSAGGAGETPISGGASAFSYVPGGSQAAGHGATAGGIVNLRNAETADPYYRPPRQRRTTMDANSPQERTRGSWGSPDWANKRWSHHSPDLEGSPQPTEGPSASGRDTPIPVHLSGARDRSDSDAEEPRQSKTDYATREVDFYYGVRGPALSNQPTRRLKTGPADPTGPVISASGWIKSLFGGKTKEKGKGFEVVRSSRAPPMGRQTPSGAIIPGEEVRYLDEPGVNQPERSRDLALSDQGDAIGAGTRHLPDEESPVSSEDDEGDDRSLSDEDWRPNRESQISQFPPTLPNIETPGGIELPSRIASKASSRPTRESTRRSTRPSIPRKSSRRDSSTDLEKFGARLSTVAPSPPITPKISAHQRLQPPEDNSKRFPFYSHHATSPSQGTHLSAGGDSMNSSMFSPGTRETDEAGYAQHARHSSSVLGSLAPGFQQLDRPTSMGYVQQHRASDNIHTANSDGPSMLGSSAELVDDPDQRSVSPDAQQAHAF
ncbi:hypothetical protein HO133_009221 [Letharia lupina]|uniref:ML-like domain-containing protein n=1 Tax=Letharia lupina TaxID=560253 RepID=A0A8H6FFF3_9LECA|nr:uncharacterized protein HO133_009221 [Letharia lupina]KAF6226355.1 hypothetical protein HO133_009221 [Letharia lupina]